MRKEIIELSKLGRMPNESLDDTPETDLLIERYDRLLDKISPPVSLEEAEVLIKLFPDHAFYDLHWSLLRLVESSMKTNMDEYKKLIDKCPSKEWNGALCKRLQNWEASRKVRPKGAQPKGKSQMSRKN